MSVEGTEGGSAEAEGPLEATAVARLRRLAERGRVESVIELMDSIDTNVTRGVEDLRSNAASGNFAEVREIAHKMRGSAATFGAMQLSASLRTLENAAAAGEPDSTMIPAVEASASDALAALAELKTELLNAGG